MTPIKTSIHENNNFELFREQNITLISGINRTVESIIADIENEENSLMDKVASIDKHIKDLSSIYFSFHSMSGNETLIRLKSLLNIYMTEARANQDRITAARFLVKKLNHLVSGTDYVDSEPFRNISPFPYAGIDKDPGIIKKSSPMGNKWITFKRNNSWFITRFTSLDTINLAGSEIVYKTHGMITAETVEKQKFESVDLMRGPGNSLKPKFLMHPHKNDFFYAADIIGRKIYSAKDFISPMIKKMKKSENKFISGRVRLFGTSHLYIVSNQ